MSDEVFDSLTVAVLVPTTLGVGIWDALGSPIPPIVGTDWIKEEGNELLAGAAKLLLGKLDTIVGVPNEANAAGTLPPSCCN